MRRRARLHAHDGRLSFEKHVPRLKITRSLIKCEIKVGAEDGLKMDGDCVITARRVCVEDFFIR